MKLVYLSIGISKQILKLCEDEIHTIIDIDKQKKGIVK
jgi:hypothetical protein